MLALWRADSNLRTNRKWHCCTGYPSAKWRDEDGAALCHANTWTWVECVTGASLISYNHNVHCGEPLKHVAHVNHSGFVWHRRAKVGVCSERIFVHKLMLDLPWIIPGIRRIVSAGACLQSTAHANCHRDDGVVMSLCNEEAFHWNIPYLYIQA